MKKATNHYRVISVGLGICVAALGVWALRHEGVQAAQKPEAVKTELLSSLPAAAGSSASDKEVAKWTAVVRLNDKEARPWANLGDALMQKARETGDAAYYGHAERVYQKALALEPKHIEAITGMAWVTSCRHEFEKSVEWANKVLALDPRNNFAYGLLGDADIEMGDYEAAFGHYQKMIDLRPDLSSYSRAAHLLSQTGNTTKAVWLMSKAIRAGAPFAENTAWCHAQLALILFDDGMIVPAQQVLERALKQTPRSYPLLAAMGKVQAARKKYDVAIDFYKKAISIAPQQEAVVALGDLYKLTGKAEEAEKQYALVETIHKLSKANGVLGEMQMAMFYADHDKNLPEALKIAETEYTTRKNLYATDTLAWCYYKNGRYEEARKAIDKAVKQRAMDSRLLYHAGMIYAKLGRRSAAQTYLQRALSQNPNFSPLHTPIAYETLAQLGGSASPRVAAASRSEE